MYLKKRVMMIFLVILGIIGAIGVLFLIWAGQMVRLDEMERDEMRDHYSDNEG